MSLNLGLRFLLELSLLCAFGYWGIAAHTSVAQVLFGIGTPLVVAVIWGIWIAPHSRRRLSDPSRLMLEVALFALAVLGLMAVQQIAIAISFGLLVTINLVIMFIAHQR